MKTSSERANVWHVVVTLAAMFYLSCGTRAITQILYPPGGNSLFQADVVLSTAAAFLGLLVVLTWIFLLRDLIRQVSLFFGKRAR
jgi:hypothetical protein